MAKKQPTKRTPAPQQATNRCLGGVCRPRRTQGLKAPVPNGTHSLVNLAGPGVFLAAEITKQGDTNDITFVILDIDGQNVTNISFAALANQGLTQHNPYGLAVFHSAVLKTVTFGFPAPLFFSQSLKLSVTVNEPNVAQIVANVIHGA
jgi:hypothetical protein